MLKVCTLRNGLLEQEIENHKNIELMKYIWDAAHSVRVNEGGLLNLFIKHNPDVFIFYKDLYLTPTFLLTLKRKSPKTKFVMWYGDQRGYKIPKLIVTRKNVLDMLLITNCDEKQNVMYKDFGINHVHTFYHSVFKHDMQSLSTPITHQIFFGGNNFKRGKFPLGKFRFNLITEVNKRFKLLIYGDGWPFTKRLWAHGINYTKILRSANMNLGVNHYNIVRYYDRRLFDCIVSGRMHITYYIPEMEKDFENHKHLVWFKTIPEGIKLIKYYLINSKEREQIAKQGRDFLLQHWSVSNRATQLISLLRDL